MVHLQGPDHLAAPQCHWTWKRSPSPTMAASPGKSSSLSIHRTVLLLDCCLLSIFCVSRNSKPSRVHTVSAALWLLSLIFPLAAASATVLCLLLPYQVQLDISFFWACREYYLLSGLELSDVGCSHNYRAKGKLMPIEPLLTKDGWKLLHS